MNDMSSIAAARAAQSAVTFDKVSKQYGAVQVLDDISFDIGAGEFVTLLGPSGSGKTTLLQVLAGFVRPSAGSVRVDGREILFTPPHKRNLGIVFQSYALFPHMTVAQNVAYPLQLRRVDKTEQARRVAQALDTVQLGALGDRRIDQLSGGQRQRVALARAIVFEPGILLMDEPLSALDKKLREQMQIELRRLHSTLGMTTVLVTHDQREALSLSDRIGVIDRGRLVQLGTPEDIYDRPTNRFVADFIGDTSFVVLQAAPDGSLLVQGRPLVANAPITAFARPALVLRPEKLRLLAGTEQADNVIDATARDIAFQGESLLVIAVLPDGSEIGARLQPGDAIRGELRPGLPMRFALDRHDVIVVDDA